MSGSLATSKISSTVGVWSYDKSRSCIISDTSFKVNGTILDWFNIDFLGVETYRIVVQSIQSFSFGLWLLIFSRKEYFSYNRILGGINSVFNNLLQRIDNRFEIIDFSNAIFSFILPIFKAWYFLRTESLIFAISLAIYSWSLLLSMSMYRNQSIISRYCKVIKFFSVWLIGSALSITRNPYFCYQHLRHKSQKSSYDMIDHVIVVHAIHIDIILFEQV